MAKPPVQNKSFRKLRNKERVSKLYETNLQMFQRILGTGIRHRSFKVDVKEVIEIPAITDRSINSVEWNFCGNLTRIKSHIMTMNLGFFIVMQISIYRGSGFARMCKTYHILHLVQKSTTHLALPSFESSTILRGRCFCGRLSIWKLLQKEKICQCYTHGGEHERKQKMSN